MRSSLTRYEMTTARCKLNLENHELAALEGGTRMLSVEVMLCEVSFHDYYTQGTSCLTTLK